MQLDVFDRTALAVRGTIEVTIIPFDSHHHYGTNSYCFQAVPNRYLKYYIPRGHIHTPYHSLGASNRANLHSVISRAARERRHHAIRHGAGSHYWLVRFAGLVDRHGGNPPCGKTTRKAGGSGDVEACPSLGYEFADSHN